MNSEILSALITVFAMAFHIQEKTIKVYDDYAAKALLSENEYELLANYLYKAAIKRYPSLEGYKDEAIKQIINKKILPLSLALTLFSEGALNTATYFGIRQYVLIGAKYNTFSYRQSVWSAGLEIFEVDTSELLDDKTERLKSAGINIPKNVHYITLNKKSASDNLIQNPSFKKDKLTYYCVCDKDLCLDPYTFEDIIKSLSSVMSSGSGVIFYYNSTYGIYDYHRIERLLQKYGLLIYEHLSANDMERLCFESYNDANPLYKIHAVKNISYCLAVKK